MQCRFVLCFVRYYLKTRKAAVKNSIRYWSCTPFKQTMYYYAIFFCIFFFFFCVRYKSAQHTTYIHTYICRYVRIRITCMQIKTSTQKIYELFSIFLYRDKLIYLHSIYIHTSIHAYVFYLNKELFTHITYERNGVRFKMLLHYNYQDREQSI